MDALSRTLSPTRSFPTVDIPRLPLKLSIINAWRNGYWPDLQNPTTFNELVQARKLKDRSPLLPILADKARVKDYVSRRLGRQWVIPTLWVGEELPERPQWALPIVVKATHACGRSAFVRSTAQDWSAIRRRAAGWLRHSYGGILDEWLYQQIEPRLLVEPFVGERGALPVDYKFFVFGGRAEFVQVDTDREHKHKHKRVLLDCEWRRLPAELQFPTETRDVPRPESLHRMIEAAETLSRGFDFVRVDFYEVGERPIFGEMTFYPGSGLDRFRPLAVDKLFGQHWLRARRRMPSW